MNIRAILAIAASVAFLNSAAASAAAEQSAVDISGAEVAGTSGPIDVNVFGTFRCDFTGPFSINVTVQQDSTGGLATGGTAFGVSYFCPNVGAIVHWVVTANGGPFVVGDMVTITAVAIGPPDETPVASDTEDHVLRWGR